MTASAAINGVLGLAYWSIAARRYSTAAVGEGSAAISALMLIAGVAQLNLLSMLMRFVPTQGARSRRLVLGAYAISVAIAAVLSAAFVLVAGHLSPGLRFFTSSRLLEIGFVAATTFGAVSVLQDAALTAVHSAGWVVVENAALAVTKLVLVVVLAVALPRSGILLSWTGALLVSVVVANVYLFRRPLRRGSTGQPTEKADLGDLARYVGPDYIGELLWLAAIAGLPLVVIARIGATEYAYFGVAWTITYLLYQAAGNLGYSLLVEGALRPEAVPELWMRVIRHMAPLLVTVVLVLVAAAPWVLAPFGAEYSAHGTTVFRLLALSAIPGLITSTVVNVARAQRRTWLGLAVLGSLCGGVVLGSIVLLPVLGAVAVGVSWLVAQLIVAAGVLACRARWLPGQRLDLRVAPTGWRVLSGSRGRARQPQPVLAEGEAGMVPPLDVVARALEVELGGPADSLVAELRPLAQSADLRSIAISVGDQPFAVARRPLTERGTASLERESAVVRGLRKDLAGSDLLRLLAQPHWFNDGHHRCLVQPWLPGRTGAALAATPGSNVAVLVDSALTTVHRLHEVVGAVGPADSAATLAWVDEGIGALESLAGGGISARRRQRQIAELRSTLRHRLRDKQALMGMAHNNLWLGNLVFSCGSLSGILDWTHARPCLPLAVDACTLGVTTWAASTGRSLGEVTVRALTAGGWTMLVSGHLGVPPRSFLADPGLDESTIALLTWLQHVATNLRSSGRYRDNPLWVHNNVDRVLAARAWQLPRHPSSPSQDQGDRIGNGVEPADSTSARLAIPAASPV